MPFVVTLNHTVNKISKLFNENLAPYVIFRFLKRMQNEAGEYVDLYIPRKCSVTNRVIGAKDHASVQINVGEVDETGRYTGSYKTYALCGFIRKQGEGDDALTRLCVKDGVINKNYHS